MVIEPRFRGGTSTAVIRQLAELVRIADVKVYGIRSAMFGERPACADLLAEIHRLGLKLEWEPDRIVADAIILHNPAFLKFQSRFNPRMVCRKLVLVTHENFLLPGGTEAFDVAMCLSLIEESAICADKILAPVSTRNRQIAQDWLTRNDADWCVSDRDWINICDNPVLEPTAHPRDRRGRHSRPGPEKFPDLATLHQLFPETAEYCGIMGGEGLAGPDAPRHWDLIPFDGKPVPEFLSGIDFFVYFTNPLWHESFGMVLAEAISAGKLVITSPTTAYTFGDGLVGVLADEVGPCIARHLEKPTAYQAGVRDAQAGLSRYSGQRFRDNALALLA